MESSPAWFFESWQGVARVAGVGALAYFVVVLFLRFSGNRTLAKTAAFDHVITVALGSTLATILLSRALRPLRYRLGSAGLKFRSHAGEATHPVHQRTPVRVYGKKTRPVWRALGIRS